jgi:hypothetical protein
MALRVPPYQYEVLDRTPGVWIRLTSIPALQKDFWIGYSESLTDDEADAIMTWTMQNKCGVRMSFDMWKFRNEAELTAFVLKWC